MSVTSTLLSYYVACPYGTENVAHDDISKLMAQYTPILGGNDCGKDDQNNWFELEPLERCWTRRYGPPLPYTALKLSFGAKGGIAGSGPKRVMEGNKERNAELRRRAGAGAGAEGEDDNATAAAPTEVTATATATGHKRQRSEEGATTTASATTAEEKAVIAGGDGDDEPAAAAEKKAPRNTFLPTEQIHALNLEETIWGSKDCDEEDDDDHDNNNQANGGSAATQQQQLQEEDGLPLPSKFKGRSFKGTVSFRFNVPMDTVLNSIAGTTTTTPRRLLLEGIYQLRSVSGVFVHIVKPSTSSSSPAAAAAGSFTAPPLTPYNPYARLPQQRGLLKCIDDLFDTRGGCNDSNNNTTTTYWDAIVDEINAIRASVVVGGEGGGEEEPFLSASHRPLLLAEKEGGEEKKNSNNNSGDALAMYRVSALRLDKTQVQAAAGGGGGNNGGGKKKNVNNPDANSNNNASSSSPRRPLLQFIKVTSVELERFTGGLIGERLCPEMADGLFSEEEEEEGGKGAHPTPDPATLRPLPPRAYRASMLYHHLEVTCLHDHDRLLLGICVHDSNAPRVDKEERPFAETAAVSLKQRNDTRRAIVQQLLPAVTAGREAYGRLLALIAEEEKKKENNATLTLQFQFPVVPNPFVGFEPVKQPTMARPSSFKHDVRLMKGDNSMNPVLASMMAWHLMSSKTKTNDKEKKNDSAAENAAAAVAAPYLCIDPLGGTGTTMMEAFLRYNYAPTSAASSSSPLLLPIQFIAGDLRLSESKPMRNNFMQMNEQIAAMGLMTNRCCAAASSSASTSSAAALLPFLATSCHWDASKLPFKDGAVDGIISDLPFGRRCGNASINDQLYVQLLQEFHRVLAMPTTTTAEDDQKKKDNDTSCTSSSQAHNLLLHTGRCVLLTIERRLMITALVEAACKKAPFKVVTRPFMVDMGGLMPYVFVLEKVAVPAAEV